VTLVRPDGSEERVDLAALRADTPFPFVLACRASRLRELLRARLPAESLRGRSEVVRVLSEDEGVAVDVRLGDSMQVEVLRGTVAVGCDGSGSLLRRRLKIAFDQVPEERAWVMAEVSVADPPRADLALSADGARVPLGGGQERWVLALADDEDGLELDRAQPLAEAAARRWGTVPAIGDVACYRYFSMQDRVARDWRNGRVFLAGRAAHLTNPIWDADASLSIADAGVLAARIAAGEPMGYGEERRASLERVLAPDGMAWLCGGDGLGAAREWMLVS